MIPLPYVEGACPMGTASETPRAFSKPMAFREMPVNSTFSSKPRRHVVPAGMYVKWHVLFRYPT